MLTPLLLISVLSPAQADSLLMLGNSYTFTNDLDGVTQEILVAGAPADWKGGTTARLADGGLLFIDHLDRLADPKSSWYSALASGNERWDWVVLQEQSQIPGFPAEEATFQESLAAAGALDDVVEENGAQTVFLLTWGRRDGDPDNAALYPDYSTMQARLLDGYRAYRDASATSPRPTWIAPAGLAFARIHDKALAAGEDPLLQGSLFYSLYAPDGGHPSPRGTYLTACVLFSTLTGVSSVGLPGPDALDAALIQALQEAADYAVFEVDAGLDYPWSTGPGEDTGPFSTSDSDDPDSAGSGGDGDGDGDDAGGCGCGDGGEAGLWLLPGLLLLGLRRRG